MAGPNGSGKTTTTELLLANEWGANSLYINPDNIAEHEFGGWNSPDAVMKAAQRATELRYQQMELDDQETMTIEEAREMTHRAVSREYALDRDMTPEQLYAVISEEIDDIYANGRPFYWCQ